MTGEVVSIEVVAFDRRRPDKCGPVQVYPECVLMWAEADRDVRPKRSGEREPTAYEKRLAGYTEKSKNAQHAHHYTRNIRLYAGGLATESVVKIHPPLIIRFNGEETCP